jgi:hypothetical protein
MMLHSKARWVAALALVCWLTLSCAAPATAAVESWSCGANNSFQGTMGSTGAQTREIGDCFTLGVRARYAHVGGSSWTTWTYSSFLAIRGASNTFQSEHSNSRSGTIEALP